MRRPGNKIEAEKLELQRENFQLDGMLESVASVIRESAEEKGIQVRVGYQGMPMHLSGDLTRLRQALLNYAANALKFTASGHIHLRAEFLGERAEGIHARFEVEDTGLGIDPEKASAMFNAFEQADASTSGRFGGTGLGLAVTRRLAQMMGGEAGVESVAGEGSRFWFTVCLQRGQSAPQPGMPGTAADPAAALRASYGGARPGSAQRANMPDSPPEQAGAGILERLSSEAGVDISRLETVLGGNVALYLELLRKLQAMAQQALQPYQGGVLPQDLRDLRALAHKLKGSAANLGVSGICSSAAALESACAEAAEGAAPAECIRHAFSGLQSEVEAFSAILSSAANHQDLPREVLVDPVLAQRGLAELEALLARQDAAAVDFIAEQGPVIEAALGSGAEKLMTEVINFEFGPALQTLRALRGK